MVAVRVVLVAVVVVATVGIVYGDSVVIVDAVVGGSDCGSCWCWLRRWAVMVVAVSGSGCGGRE